MAALLLVPVGGARRSAVNLSLVINFFANGTITVTLPDGTPVGTTGGQPTIIPAGFYTLVYSGPGGCTNLPFFHLTGPGTNIVSNMNEGLSSKTAMSANLLPSSTYVWTSDGTPGVTHTFVTSAQVEGAPPSGVGGVSSGTLKGKPVTNQDIVGSDVVPKRGTLAVAISASGRMALAYKGKSVSRLKSGIYNFAVTDRSSTDGFALVKSGRSIAVTTPSFVGTRAKSVRLVAGRWKFAAGAAGYTIVVS